MFDRAMQGEQLGPGRAARFVIADFLQPLLHFTAYSIPGALAGKQCDLFTIPGTLQGGGEAISNRLGV
jgi:hypothetical protein